MILMKHDQTENNTPVRFTPEAIESMFEQMKKNGYPVYRDKNKNICIKGSVRSTDFLHQDRFKISYSTRLSENKGK